MRKHFLSSLFPFSQQYSLQGRLLLYFSIVIFLVFVCAVGVFFAFDMAHITQKNISKSLDDYLATYEKSVSQQFSNLAAYSLQMKKNVEKNIEKTFKENGLSFSDLENNEKALGIVLRNVNDILKTSLYISKASGAYIVLDTTINNNLLHSQNSRSGIYFKIMNIASPNDANPTVYLFRGIPQLAIENAFELHSSWDLEIDVSPYVSAFAALRASTVKISPNAYSLTVPHQLENGWEKVILFGAPILGEKGEFYGACGFEMNELLYNLLYMHIKPSLQYVTGVVATQGLDEHGKEELTVYTHFSNGNPYAFVNDIKNFSIKSDEFYDVYFNDTEEFIGKSIDIRIFPNDFLNENVVWKVVAMMPKDRADELIWAYYAKILFFIVLCIGFAFILAYYFAKRYSSPIVAILSDIQSGNNMKTDIVEFTDFMEYFKQKEKKLRLKLEAEENTLPKDKKDLLHVDISAYNIFISQLETLTKSERVVFELYTQGFTAQGIADELNVSINTIRTHNRNIYSKLYVSSYKEMMVYIKMMAGNDRA